jgi:hypothetical protein
MTISKTYSFDEQTKTEIIIDDRIFQMCLDYQLKAIRDKAKELILEVAPEYKQRNAALGLLADQEIQQIKTDIQNIRNISNSLEQQILAVTWDGTEETRPSACDAVQNVRWP